MPRKVGHAIHDILEAIGRVEEITRHRTFADFEANWQLQWLVQRAIEIISEASRAIPPELTNRRPEIPWSRVAAIGNVLRYEYSGLSTELSGMSWSMNCRA